MNAHCSPPIAALVLAAGSATRMGSLKQLLPYKNGTLIGHAIEVAMRAGFAPILVVVGAEASRIEAALANRPVEIVYNDQWQSGMGSSIAAGIRRLIEMETDSAGVAILLADQPLITPDHLQGMRELLADDGTGAVAADYDGALGVPALFKRFLFERLAALSAQSGAKMLLRDPTNPVVAFPLPQAVVDIDTPDDFAALR